VDKESNDKRPGKDWFGYGLTLIGSAIVAIVIAWYQTSTAQRDAAEAELERVRAVKQSMASIVEELVLNLREIDLERLTRLVDQRRREEKISIPISASEVVELADYSISNSRHLSVTKKEEIKPYFDKFYKEVNSRAFKPAQGANAITSPLVNDIAKKIQEGKGGEALAILARLEESRQQELLDAQKRATPGFIDVLSKALSSPKQMAITILAFVVYMALVSMIYTWLKARRMRRLYDDNRPL
jgi:hypothetical protein